MCIRDSSRTGHARDFLPFPWDHWRPSGFHGPFLCLLYTSDAADERSSVDLGGRRIIKKKNTIKLEKVREQNYNEKHDNIVQRNNITLRDSNEQIRSRK